MHRTTPQQPKTEHGIRFYHHNGQPCYGTMFRSISQLKCRRITQTNDQLSNRRSTDAQWWASIHLSAGVWKHHYNLRLTTQPVCSTSLTTLQKALPLMQTAVWLHNSTAWAAAETVHMWTSPCATSKAWGPYKAWLHARQDPGRKHWQKNLNWWDIFSWFWDRHIGRPDGLARAHAFCIIPSTVPVAVSKAKWSKSQDLLQCGITMLLCKMIPHCLFVLKPCINLHQHLSSLLDGKHLHSNGMSTACTAQAGVLIMHFVLQKCRQHNYHLAYYARVPDGRFCWN